jgi:hypothetical protein
MWFEGNPLWLIGIALLLGYGFWWFIKVCYHLEEQDHRTGRRDLDDDGHMPFH